MSRSLYMITKIDGANYENKYQNKNTTTKTESNLGI